MHHHATITQEREMTTNKATLAHRAKTLGFELYSDHSWHQGDDGLWRSRWCLHKLTGRDGHLSPYQRDASFYRTLRDVADRLDHEQISSDRRYG
jgi:hypothetical protein